MEVKRAEGLIGKTPIDWTDMSSIFSRVVKKRRRKTLRMERGEIKNEKEMEVKNTNNLIGKTLVDWTRIPW
jgi:hypothetical protein